MKVHTVGTVYELAVVDVPSCTDKKKKMSISTSS
uniref:Uncharacterized protein n=1 Tax=Anguilla anguilla TaxID=7936 RepID=A0A0E9VRF4_ANGAN